MAMLDDLVEQVSKRTGLPKEKALEAAQSTIAFLDEKLPPPLGGRIKAALEGDASALGSVTDAIGGMFGR